MSLHELPSVAQRFKDIFCPPPDCPISDLGTVTLEVKAWQDSYMRVQIQKDVAKGKTAFSNCTIAPYNYATAVLISKSGKQWALSYIGGLDPYVFHFGHDQAHMITSLPEETVARIEAIVEKGEIVMFYRHPQAEKPTEDAYYAIILDPNEGNQIISKSLHGKQVNSLINQQVPIGLIAVELT
jgi:hypothetical protein